MNESNYPFPTERIDLASKGIIYPESDPASKGYVDIKYMGAKEEDIITNENYLKNGTAVNKLLESVIVTSGIKLDKLISGDREKIMIATRILGIGDKYTFTGRIRNQPKTITMSLSELEDKPVDESLFKRGFNEFEYTVEDKMGTRLTYKLLTGEDENIIQKEKVGRRKINPDFSGDTELSLKQMIVAVNGERDKNIIRNFIDNAFPSLHIKKFILHVKNTSPGINLNFKWTDPETEVVEDLWMPVTVEFFWPDLTR